MYLIFRNPSEPGRSLGYTDPSISVGLCRLLACTSICSKRLAAKRSRTATQTFSLTSQVILTAVEAAWFSKQQLSNFLRWTRSTCVPKIVTELAWEHFRNLIFCVDVARSYSLFRFSCHYALLVIAIKVGYGMQ